jgi:hypothetical protein
MQANKHLALLGTEPVSLHNPADIYIYINVSILLLWSLWSLGKNDFSSANVVPLVKAASSEPIDIFLKSILEAAHIFSLALTLWSCRL